MIYEFCAENITLLDKALEAGAKRVELCDNLTVGGTTPSYGVIEAAVRMVKPYDATVMTMIRPRGGDFVYTDLEIEIMLADIQKAKEAGSQGVVFGVLTEKNKIDVSKMRRLLEACKGLEVVFHMAFDSIPAEYQFGEMDWLTENGVQRILTHGGPANEPIEEHFAWLDELIEHAADRIDIMPGGGIHLGNRQKIIDSLAVEQLHGTKIVF